MWIKDEISKCAKLSSEVDFDKSKNLKKRRRKIPVLKFTSVAALILSLYLGKYFSVKCFLSKFVFR